MWWTLPLILLTGWLSLRYSDIEHESALNAVVLPLLCLLSAIALAVWLVVYLYRYCARPGRTARGNPGIVESSEVDIDAGGD